MQNVIRIFLAAAVWGASVPLSAAGPRPVVQVAFVLDTTGSMSGLIEAAKAKIWSIANEIAKGKPSPEIRMALVGYRDRGDAYVTRTTNFSDNLDAMYSDLMKFTADGGGDSPEHVWKAVQDAVNALTWSQDPRAFKVIYLVGDAPAHREYGDTPPIEKILEKAVRDGIVINTIQCGADAATSQEWREIARRAEGAYLAIAQDGGVAVAATPFDAEIATLSGRLGETALGYGARAEKVSASRALGSGVVAMSAPSAAADRATFKMREGYAEGDLLKSIKAGEVSLESIAEKDLPRELKPLTPAERKAKVAALEAERTTLEKSLAGLTAQRTRFLTDNAKGPKTGFDQELLKALKAQAAKKGIAY